MKYKLLSRFRTKGKLTVERISRISSNGPKGVHCHLESEHSSQMSLFILLVVSFLFLSSILLVSSVTQDPTVAPTCQPVAIPTRQPSRQPTKQPTLEPSLRPTICPSYHPTSQPSSQPSGKFSPQPILATF